MTDTATAAPSSSSSSSSSSTTPADPPSRPARRPGRNRKATPLAESFKEYVDNAPPDEVQDLTDQLHLALGSIANGSGSRADASENNNGRNSNGSVTASCVGRIQTGMSDMNITESPTSNRSPHAANPRAVAAERRQSGDEYYAPKSSSRRNSRAGSELSISMKIAAQKALAELGEISDDDDDDPLLEKLGVMDGVIIREESMRGILREDSKYSSHS